MHAMIELITEDLTVIDSIYHVGTTMILSRGQIYSIMHFYHVLIKVIFNG